MSFLSSWTPRIYLHMSPCLSLGIFIKPPVPNSSCTPFLVLTHSHWFPIDSDVSPTALLHPLQWLLFLQSSLSQDLVWTIPLPCWSFLEMLHPHRPAGHTVLLEAVPVALPGVIASSLHLSCRSIIAEKGFITFTAGNPGLSARPASWVLNEQYWKVMSLQAIGV